MMHSSVHVNGDTYGEFYHWKDSWYGLYDYQSYLEIKECKPDEAHFCNNITDFYVSDRRLIYFTGQRVLQDWEEDAKYREDKKKFEEAKKPKEVKNEEKLEDLKEVEEKEVKDGASVKMIETQTESQVSTEKKETSKEEENKETEEKVELCPESDEKSQEESDFE